MTAANDIGCKLYDNNNVLLKTLSMCTIPAGLLTSGYNYYIKYYYVPNSY